MTEAERNQRGVVLLDELHAEMAQGTGVHPFDIFDRIGVIIAILRDGYDPDEEVCDHAWTIDEHNIDVCAKCNEERGEGR